MARRLDVGEVEQALTVPLVLHLTGGPLTERALKARHIACPIHHGHDRGAFAWSLDERRWHCFTNCGRGGFVLDLVAALYGVDRRDVLPLAASLVGLDGESGAVRGGHHRVREPFDAAEAARCQARNQALWDRLTPRHPAGEAYLAARCLLPAMRADRVRFLPEGHICVPLRALDDGRVVNVAVRRIDEARPKVEVQPGTTRALLGDVRLLPQSLGPVVLTEGVTDYLTAVTALDPRLALGVTGAAHLAPVVRALAPRLRDRGFLFAAHDDGPGGAGLRAVEVASCEAQRLGVPGDRLLALNLWGARDLNAWHCQSLPTPPSDQAPAARRAA
jgi:hypothetical protein